MKLLIYLESLAICSVGRIEEITEHVVSLYARFVDGAKRSLALIFVEAFLHVSNGSSGVNLVTASYAVHAVLSLVLALTIRVSVQLNQACLF